MRFLGLNKSSHLSSKLSRSAGIFSKLRYYLNQKTLIEMYHALFNSHLQYAILCWGSTFVTNLHRLQVLQNRAIRNMMKAPRYFRLDNYYLNLRILKVCDLYNLEVAKFMHNHHNQLLPDCFSSFFTDVSLVTHVAQIILCTIPYDAEMPVVKDQLDTMTS